MTLTQLIEAIKAKTLELEVAREAGKPDSELLELYKQLKELQYQKLQTELNLSAQDQ